MNTITPDEVVTAVLISEFSRALRQPRRDRPLCLADPMEAVFDAQAMSPDLVVLRPGIVPASEAQRLWACLAARERLRRIAPLARALSGAG